MAPCALSPRGGKYVRISGPEPQKKSFPSASFFIEVRLLYMPASRTCHRDPKLVMATQRWALMRIITGSANRAQFKREGKKN